MVDEQAVVSRLDDFDGLTETQRRAKRRLAEKLGEFRQYLDNDQVDEFLVNPDGKLFVEYKGRGKMDYVGEVAPDKVDRLLREIASSLGTVIDENQPILDGQLPYYDCRVHGEVSPIVTGPSITVRKPSIDEYTLDDYVTMKVITQEQREIFRQAIRDRENILVVGGTKTGKTTFLNAFLVDVAVETPDHRVIILEDTPELKCKSQNKKEKKAEGQWTMQVLAKGCMRDSPDRIVVGETRGGEALDMIQLWNTGHPGGLSSTHANSALEGLDRIESLIQLVSLSPQQKLIAKAINLVVCLVREKGVRKVSEIIRIRGFENGRYLYEEL